MEDGPFEQLRDALAPGRERTSRLGALFVLEGSLDGDDRLLSLMATLLADRDPEVAAGVALVAYGAGLGDNLKAELDRAWSLARPEYRFHLLRDAGREALEALAQRYAECPDSALKLAFLQRLPLLEGSPAGLDAALYLSHDSSRDVRASAARALGALAGPGPRAALIRLMSDAEPAVRMAAARAFALLAEPDDIATYLHPLGEDADFDVRGTAAEAAGIARERFNRAAVAPLIERQKKLIAEGDYTKALAIAAQVFMRVADHAECQYQMARAAAGMGDIRRALRLLANAFEAGFAGRDAALNEPLFAPLRETPMWPEVMEMARE